MIVNLQNIMSDFYGNYEEPVLSITTLSEDYICPVIEPSAFTSNFKFNDISEINFTVADKIYADGKFIENPSYEELIGMRRIVMEPFGALSNSGNNKDLRRAAKATRQPLVINREAISCPMPELAPTTIAVFIFGSTFL